MSGAAPAITVNVFTASAPANLTSDPTSSADGAYALSWDAVSDAATYKLREGETELSLSSNDVQNRTHSVTGKETGSYSYQVRACHTNDNDLCSDWSSAITVNVFTASAPTLTLTLTSTETRAEDGTYRSADGIYTLTWTSVTDAATYELQEVMSESNTPLSLTPEDVQNRTHMISEKPGGSYSYRVRACHMNTACTAWSDLSVSVSRNCADSQQASGFHDGLGTAASPYLICDYIQLAKMRVNAAVTNVGPT